MGQIKHLRRFVDRRLVRIVREEIGNEARGVCASHALACNLIRPQFGLQCIAGGHSGNIALSRALATRKWRTRNQGFYHVSGLGGPARKDQDDRFANPILEVTRAVGLSSLKRRWGNWACRCQSGEGRNQQRGENHHERLEWEELDSWEGL